ncbi:hypothetical protein [Rhizobium fabae]|uniref:hypothetical protein n=1 Tax=Rhizobium fabae TaxID=573179 RepID=UPI0013E03105|nr:hypothetical protein [Rhizobium fabae]
MAMKSSYTTPWDTICRSEALDFAGEKSGFHRRLLIAGRIRHHEIKVLVPSVVSAAGREFEFIHLSLVEAVILVLQKSHACQNLAPKSCPFSIGSAPPSIAPMRG